MSDGRKTQEEYWDGVHSGGRLRLRLPSPLVIGTRNVQRVLRPYLRSGTKALEIGCAPGKHLAWAASLTGTEVSGIDYSKHGVDLSRSFFKALGLAGDIRHEDVFASTFPRESFDFVYSLGVIEHFDDPRPIVRTHVDFIKPGGHCLILVPNYGGWYGAAQAWADPVNLGIHNLSIMSCSALEALAPTDHALSVRAFPTGNVDGAIVTWSHRLPRLPAQTVQLALNALGLLQPFHVRGLSPFLALLIERHSA